MSPNEGAGNRLSLRGLIAQGFAGELDYDAELQNLDRARPPRAGAKAHDRNRPGSNGPNGVNKKRQAKDSKFGTRVAAASQPTFLDSTFVYRTAFASTL